ncbi:MAG TPA: hypothetical protein VEK57_02230 [Thermoanaerobaculia bacterium]|nr:hypothetical protein [Thermoanaerobaculia bacterium]
MPYKLLAVTLALIVCAPLFAQDVPPPPEEANVSKDAWAWSHRVELRGNYRWSEDEFIPNPFFDDDDPATPPEIFLRTPDPGSHVDLNVAEVQLDVFYGEWFQARAKIHAQGMHRRNPTSTDKQVDADELFVRIGQKPEFLDRPAGTSFFLQAGKFPKMERQPVRLLESYGLAATSFNRFEDIQLLAGGTVGRNFYWRFQAANGNPVFLRDPNALAGDNGTLDEKFNNIGDYHSGFPIIYHAETEDYVFNTSHVQLGEALGYRWQRDDGTLGFDLIVFHYERDLAEKEELTGTIYGGDIDLLDEGGPAGSNPDKINHLPITGSRKKEEIGARLFAEWHNATVIAQYTAQELAGLEREGMELELGYRLPWQLGWIESIQPAVRASRLDNHFVGVGPFPAPSLFWDWNKIDFGVRVGLPRGLDVTAEYTVHDMTSRRPLGTRETLVTVRWRS